MAFLELDGITVPVSVARQITDEIGDRGRAHSGKYATAIRTQKRQWEMTTPPLTPSDYEIVRGLVLGTGQYWPYDVDEASTKGVIGDTTVGTFAELFADVPAPLDGSVDQDLTIDFGAGVGRFSRTTQELLAADARVDATTNFIAGGGATLGLDSFRFIGTNSLSVVDATPPGGALLATPGTVASGVRCVGSLWLFNNNSTPDLITVQLRDLVNGGLVSTFPNIGKGWTRVETPSLVVGASASAMRIDISQNGGSNVDFLADAWQIDSASRYATPFVDTSLPTAAAQQLTSDIYNSATNFSINIWTRGPRESDVKRVLFSSKDLRQLSGTGRSEIEIRLTAADVLTAAITADDGTTDTLTRASSFTETAGENYWHMVTVTWTQNPSGGADQFRAYYDGVIFGSTFTGETMDSANMTTTFFGCDIDATLANGWDGTIDDASILPFALTQSAVTKLAAATTPRASLPRVRMTGDIIPSDVSVDVVGKLGDADYLRHISVDGVAFNNTRRLAFTLWEV